MTGEDRGNGFERFMWERFGIEPLVDEHGECYFERWQIEDALERELAGEG